MEACCNVLPGDEEHLYVNWGEHAHLSVLVPCPMCTLDVVMSNDGTACRQECGAVRGTQLCTVQCESQVSSMPRC